MPQAGPNGSRSSSNRVDGLLEAISRHQILLLDIAESAELADDPYHCRIDQWLAEDSGFSVFGQLTLGFAAFASCKAQDAEAVLSDRSVLPPNFFQDLAVRLGGDGASAMALLAESREWYRQQFTRGEQTHERAAWERTAFEAKPLLRLEKGHLLVISPRALESWLSDGFYHRALDAARTRGEVQRFQIFFGRLVEEYALRLLRSAHPEPRPVGSGRVSGEQGYGPGDGKRSPDVSVDCGLDLVLIEVCSGRFTLRTLLEGDPAAAMTELGRLLVGKADQLSRRIDDLFAKEWTVPGVSTDQLLRIWPVVVTADVMQNELLWNELDEQLSDALHQPRVQALTILDLPDLEQVSGLVENGHGLADLLADKAAGMYSRMDFRRYVADTASLPDKIRSSMLEQRWSVLADRTAKRLGIDPPA